MAAIVLGLAVPASAQLSSISATKNGGNSANLDNGDADVFSNVVVQSSSGTTFTTRYSAIVLADIAVGNITPSLSADYNVSFQVTTPGDYRVTVTETLNGGFSVNDDTIIVPLSASADISAVTGQVVAGSGVSSGTLSLSDAGSRNTQGSNAFSVNNGAGATIFGTSAGAAQTHTLRFTWSMSANSSADEAAVKIGLGSGQGGQSVGGSPGNAGTDGHFVTVTVTPLCGNGVIDAAAGEQCDTAIGGSVCCTSNCRFANSSTQCRASAGVCDVAENCTGSAATCPADGFASPSTVCRGSGGVCDVVEFCTGSGPNCPADGVASSSTPCRAGSGDLCDPTENCDGTNKSCPADVVTPGGTLCNAGSGDLCDPDETCTGVAGQACPADNIASPSTVCRTGSGDVCDPDETCTGVADQGCPADAVSPGGTTCRAGSGDLCDPDEVCSGNVGEACPADVVTASGTVCNPGSGDLCDPDETCTGNAGQACPADTIASPSTVCRAGSGDSCDPDETCTGNADEACPADVVTPSGTVCRTGSGDLCDADETCTGNAGEACPADSVSGAFVVCRPAAGDCDVAENCTGNAGDACPADSVSGAFVTCRPTAGACDIAENCDGVGVDCPADVVEPATTECRASAGVCDVAENCDGSNAACPADGKSTAVCRASADVCDVAESCDGVGDDCPADAFAPATTVCRPAANTCDVAETCTGTGTACPADTGQPDGDGDGVCDLIDICPLAPDPGQLDGDNDGRGDLCDPCNNIAPTAAVKPKLTLLKILAPTGDDKLKFKGTFTNVPTSPTLDPVTKGIRILVSESTGATPIDITIPGGAYSNATRSGWKSSNSGFLYKNSGKVVALVDGINKIKLTRKPSAPTTIKFSVSGKTGNYTVNTANLPLTGTLVFDTPLATTGQCGEATPACVIGGGGGTVKCK